MKNWLDYILPIGCVAIVAMLLIDHKQAQQTNADANAAADASVDAQVEQSYELTNVPTGGAYPSTTGYVPPTPTFQTVAPTYNVTPVTVSPASQTVGVGLTATQLNEQAIAAEADAPNYPSYYQTSAEAV